VNPPHDHRHPGTRLHSCLWLAAIFLLLSGTDGTPAPLPTYQEIEPLLAEYCYDCHGDGLDRGGLELDIFTSEDDILKHRKVWETVLFNVENWIMPPTDKKKQPSQEQREQLARYLENLLFYCDCDNPDPGRVTIRRLNRTEYNNTIRDLLGIRIRPADSFPDDDSGYGFDNIGDVLSLPPILMERYLIAADQALDAAILIGTPEPVVETITASEMGGGKLRDTGTRVRSKNGTIAASFYAPHRGNYKIHIHASGRQAGEDPVRAVITVGRREVLRADIPQTHETPAILKNEIQLDAGRHVVGVTFTNDYTDHTTGDNRDLIVHQITVDGPYDGTAETFPESHKRIFIASPDKIGELPAARKILKKFMNRAFRRPAKNSEVSKLLKFVTLAKKHGDSFEIGIKQALRAVLVSPHFLFRIEWQPEPDNPDKIHPISEFALASRLSYFLWSSMPDDTLLSLAFKDQLSLNLDAQIDRMLADPKSDSLAKNFAGQWLETRNLKIVAPDPEHFPKFDAQLADSMRQETETFFSHILEKNLSVLDFLTADYTFVDEVLASHYGIAEISGEQFQKVSLQGEPRRGLLGHASILTITSDPTRTSPVKRGKWILENLLGTPPPPPPPNVPTLEEGENKENEPSTTLRQRLEEHRNKTGCASCHSLMDPLGFGLENFDPVGGFRTEDAHGAIDSSGRLTSGQVFSGATQLAEILLKDRREAFLRCLTEKMLTYALGRGMEFYDKCAVEEIMGKCSDDGYRFQTLIKAVIGSVPFQKRRGDGLPKNY